MCVPSQFVHMRTYIATILTILILLGVTSFRGVSISEFRGTSVESGLKPAPFDIPHDLSMGQVTVIPETGLVVNKLPIDKLGEMKLILGRLSKFEGQVEGLPVVEDLHQEEDSLIVVFGYKEGVYPIEVLNDEAIQVIRGVLEVLRRAQISIDVRSKKDLVDCFGVDGHGKIHMVNLNTLRFLIIRKALDKSIDNALSFIDNGKRH